MSRTPPKHERRLWMRLRSRYDLIALMTQRNLSCAELARWSHCSKSTIGHLRSGAMATCTPALAARIEKALGCQPGRLFEPRTSSRLLESSTVAQNDGRALTA
jgi:plasmid maintenance system antidote protein VapI